MLALGKHPKNIIIEKLLKKLGAPSNATETDSRFRVGLYFGVLSGGQGEKIKSLVVVACHTADYKRIFNNPGVDNT